MSWILACRNFCGIVFVNIHALPLHKSPMTSFCRCKVSQMADNLQITRQFSQCVKIKACTAKKFS